MLTFDDIRFCVSRVNGISLIDDIKINEAGSLFFIIQVDAGYKGILKWDVLVSPTYPFKVLGHEQIIFKSSGLLNYPHIMEEGNLCMHSSSYMDAKSQMINDLRQLKEWVDEYYVKEKKDDHYENIVVNNNPIRNEYYNFCFADTEYEFEEGDFGTVYYASLTNGKNNGKNIKNYFIQSFHSNLHGKNNSNSCNISSRYKSFPSSKGIYCVLSEPPSVYNKFIIKDFQSIEQLFTQKQKDFIHTFEVVCKNEVVDFFPILCGYKIPCGEISWQAMIFFMDDLPIESFRIGAGKSREWHTKFKLGKIDWAQTENISYKYFFGRGAMPEKLSEKKILIMGVGAIGSIVAETLTRCGAKNITLHDIDTKESGNVCRSAYDFYTGVSEKTYDLEKLLCTISPHLDCKSLKSEFDLCLKLYVKDSGEKSLIKDFFNKFDIVFDCTADNQHMQLLDAISVSSQVINLSITNHAKELICAISPNMDKTVRLISGILDRDSEVDLYNPTGCWSPTFKASYNDISTMLQFAMCHVIKILSCDEPKSNFYITREGLNLKIHLL